MNKRCKKAGLLFLVVFTVMVSGLFTNDALSAKDSDVIRQSSMDFDSFSLDGGYIIMNNTWNRQATTGPHKQRIFLKESGGKAAFGWNWQWGQSTNVVSYPEVLYGDSPWDTNVRSAPGMPFLVGTKEVTIDFAVDLEAKGIYNMAFEFWVVSKTPAFRRDITHEVMIWNANNGMLPAGSYYDEVSFGGIKYDVFYGKNHGDASGGSLNKWDYIAFEAHTPVLSGPLNLSQFIDYLIEEGILNNSLYITTIEFGNEIVQGTGNAEIRDYKVNIE
jgi:hypothetical protein